MNTRGLVVGQKYVSLASASTRAMTEGEGRADHGVATGKTHGARRLLQRVLVPPSWLFLEQQHQLSVEKKMADAAEELERAGVNRAVKDLFAGAVGGIAQVLLGEWLRVYPSSLSESITWNLIRKSMGYPL